MLVGLDNLPFRISVANNVLVFSSASLVLLLNTLKTICALRFLSFPLLLPPVLFPIPKKPFALYLKHYGKKGAGTSIAFSSENPGLGPR